MGSSEVGGKRHSTHRSTSNFMFGGVCQRNPCSDSRGCGNACAGPSSATASEPSPLRQSPHRNALMFMPEHLGAADDLKALSRLDADLQLDLR